MARTDAQVGRERWQSVPRDPEPEDLGYELDDWEVIRARKDDRGHLMFLPESEDMLREEAFIVADDCSVCDVVDRI
ncbi:hypothetical protein NGM10_15340 [Halorussus salilacus]|uniref:hypothetical protein n=1 Tax=Halorussus salilacus TaxID=2953750 RepID=UPI00209D6DC9|nr:hypothetical protein [Halorussus salilacus]USZ68092.1 hypothetical protein NGM10_15340 [Halorussus salilacus]